MNTSNTSTATCRVDVSQSVYDSSSFEIFTLIYHGLFGTLIILLNSVAIAAMRIAVKDIQSVHYFLLNLGITNIGLPLTSMAVLLLRTCRLRHISEAFDVTFNLVAESNLLLLAIDLYVALCHPLRHSSLLTTRRVKWMIIVTWITAIVFGTSKISSALIYAKSFGKDICHCLVLQRSQSMLIIMGGTHAVLTFAFVFLTYFRIIWELARHGQILPSEEQEVSYRTTKNRKAFITIGAILGTYLVFYLPVRVAVPLLYSSTFRKSTMYSVARVAIMWSLINGICDPLIYSLRMREIRKGYTRIFRKIRPTIHSVDVPPEGNSISMIEL